MRKVIYGVALVTMALVLAACGSSPEPAPQAAPAPEPEPQAQSDLPDFVLNPPRAEDALYGIGAAKLSTINASRNQAVARARADLAFQMETVVEAAMVDYSQEAGVDGENQAVTFIENITRQISEQTIRGAVPEQYAQQADGTWWALVSVSRNGFEEAASEAFQRNEDAAFAEFKADQALDYLDNQLENNPPTAGQSGESGG